MSVCPSAAAALSVHVCVRKLAQFSAVLSQNVTKKSCMVCDKSEKYAFWITLTPQVRLLPPRRSRGAYIQF